jgi:iron complex transport system substrate-binding protein
MSFSRAVLVRTIAALAVVCLTACGTGGGSDNVQSPGAQTSTGVQSPGVPTSTGVQSGAAGGAHLTGIPSLAAGGEQLIDDFGDTLPAPGRPRRIVSLSPTTTEVLFASGAGDRVVGRSHWDQWPPEAKRVADLGNGVRPNVEAILATHPDLVVLYASADNRPAASRLRQAGVATVAVKFDRIDDFRRVVRALGRVTGDSARAAASLDTMNRTLVRVRLTTDSLPHPRVLLHAWNRPVIALGGGSYLSELVTFAGGRNVYDSVPAPSLTVSIEDVVRRNPDVVLAGPEAVADILADPSWRVLPAVRAGRVLAYDTSLVLHPSFRMGEAAASLAALLHDVPAAKR